MTPPSGFGVSFVMPASSSAFEFTVMTWPPRGMNTGLSGETRSSSWRVGIRPSSKMLSCQPDEAITHLPGSVRATRSAMAFCTSATVREPRSCTAGPFKPANS
jgi:hypothetical protein